MKTEMRAFMREKLPHKRRPHIFLVRILLVLLFVAVQSTVVVLVFRFLNNHLPSMYLLGIVLSLIAGIYVMSKNQNPAYTVAWLIPILAFPVFGGLLYLMFGSGRVSKHQRNLSKTISTLCRGEDDGTVDLSGEDTVTRLQSDCITRISGCPPYKNTKTVYYPSGEAMLPALLDDLKHAGRYIFMEYFIIDDGELWSAILTVLREKANEGVDVRVLYDDLGCVMTLPVGYEYTLRKMGIKAQVYNPFNTVLSPRPNNRDHRKLCIVDGVIGYTGGINLADEYINRRNRFGYWKDTAIRLEGDAVRSMMLQFLAVWDTTARTAENASDFLPTERGSVLSDSIVQPFTDVPMDAEQVGETVYFNLITHAERYIYITTPYLIPDHDLLYALMTAAKSGVDVRIMLPHIPDKKLVFFLSRSYYKPLLDAGVRIFEFTPGFLHAKSVVCDDRYALVGTVNLDFRSLYMHMEDAVWMKDSATANEVKSDFLATEDVSEEITAESLGHLGFLRRAMLSLLRTFAPLL